MFIFFELMELYFINEIVKKLCNLHGWAVINIERIFSDVEKTNRIIKAYCRYQVGDHPKDRGMAWIANKIRKEFQLASSGFK
jgi:hypothetical protein